MRYLRIDCWNHKIHEEFDSFRYGKDIRKHTIDQIIHMNICKEESNFVDLFIKNELHTQFFSSKSNPYTSIYIVYIELGSLTTSTISWKH